MRVDRGQWGTLNTAGLRNVVGRLLGVRGPEMPNDLHRQLQLIHDISRRDPELLFELGIIPWLLSGTVAAVAAQNSFVVLNQGGPGFINVVNRWEIVAPAATITFYTGPGLGGVARGQIASDERYNGNNGNNQLLNIAPVPSDGASAAAPGGVRLWKLTNPAIFDQPIVFGPFERFTGHAAMAVVNTVNIGMDWNVSGYAIRTIPA